MIKSDTNVIKKYLSSLDEEDLERLSQNAEKTSIDNMDQISMTFYTLVTLLGSKFIENLALSYTKDEGVAKIDDIYDTLIEGTITVEFVMNKHIMRRLRDIITLQILAIHTTSGADHISTLSKVNRHQITDEPFVKGIFLSSYLLSPKTVRDPYEFLIDLHDYYSSVAHTDEKRINTLLDFLILFIGLHQNVAVPYKLSGYLIE